MVEGARLESVYGSKAHRGFESLPLRQVIVIIIDFADGGISLPRFPWLCIVKLTGACVLTSFEPSTGPVSQSPDLPLRS